MDIPYLIQLLQNKIGILNNAKSQAFSVGDLDRLNVLDKDLISTESTMAQLNLLQAATLAANAANQDLSSVVTAGVIAAQNTVVVPDNPLASLSQYDISTYAADPLYIQKISDMLSSMPIFENASQIDAYITKEVVGSPLTGQMVIDAITKYSVDARLAMAIMELDSRFGTAGVGASTFNPGNVGNTGTETRTFASWQDGVSAVTEWLNNHRVIAPVIVPPVVKIEAPVETPPVVIPPIIPPIIPAVQATSTPVIIPTPEVVVPTATTTPPTIIPPVQATSTPIVIPPPEVVTPTATTTPILNIDNPLDATTTPAVQATSTPVIIPTPDVVIPVGEEATSTPEITATSTQARVVRIKKNRV